MSTTIKQLRQNGYKVRVIHTREMHDSLSTISARGGSTKIEVTTPDRTQTVSGEAICSPEDNFNKKIGNSIALGRALSQLECNK